MQEYFSINYETILSEKIDNDIVIINLSTGCYYNLNSTASYLWSLAVSGLNVDEIIQIYDTSYKTQSDDVKNEVKSVFGDFISNSLVSLSYEKQSHSHSIIDAPKYIKPVIEKFDDMQEMLLLDPIHEVTEKGWPYKSNE